MDEDVEQPEEPRIELKTIEEVLHCASTSPKHRTRMAGDKLHRLYDEVRALVEQEIEDSRIAAKQTARQRELEEEKRELEERLAQIHNELGGPKRSSTRERNPENATIRKWAREHGLDVPVRGRIPEHVRRAYEERDTEVRIPEADQLKPR